MKKNRSSQPLKIAITVFLLIVVSILVVIAIWANTTVEEKIVLFLLGTILSLFWYVLHLKGQIFNLKKKILRLENYLKVIKED